MVTSSSRGSSPPYQTRLRDGNVELSADTLEAGRGGTTGLRPHALLEAALAACMNMTIRMKAEALALHLSSIQVSVRLDRTAPELAIYRYRLQIEGDLSDAQRALLEESVAHCPVSDTLRRASSMVRERP